MNIGNFGHVVGGKCVLQENVSGGHIFLGTSVRGTYFPRKFYPTGQDILSILG